MTTPRWVRWLLTFLAPPRCRESILGDLEEEMRARRPSWRSWLWMVREVGGSSGWLAARRVELWSQERANRREDGAMLNVLNDIRYGLRSLRKNPGFAVMVIGTLALGIGANTVIYSVVDGVVLNPFPVPDSKRLLAVGTQYPKLGATSLNFVEHIAPAEYLDIRDRARTVEHVVAWDMGNRQVAFGEVTENLFTAFWWGDGLATLGVDAYLGRGMTEEETALGESVAVLSYRVWEAQFGADSTLVGSTILMNDSPYVVVGIMPPGIQLYGTDLWIPVGAEPERFPRNRRQFQVIGRIAEGFALDDVNAELDALARQTEADYGREYEEYEGWRLEALPWAVATTRQFRAAGFLLLGAVGFVLLLVCSNVANLLLSRGAVRTREFAVRTALGAGRRRILRQLGAESLTLALLGGVVGVGLAAIGTRGASDLLAQAPFVSGSVSLNARVLAFTAGISLLAGVAFGLFPALQAARGSLRGSLQTVSTGATRSRGGAGMQRFIVSGEVALALVLLSVGGLFVHSLILVNRVDTGFDENNVLSMRLTLAQEKYSRDGVRAFFQTLEERVSRIPGVTAVGVGSQFPPVAIGRRSFQTESMALTEAGQLPVALTNIVSPAYFDALGIPLRSGRSFTELDLPDSPQVAVVNEAAAILLFGGENAVGRQIRASPEDPWIRVVGVVGNTVNQGLDSPPAPEVFASHLQLPGWSNQLFLLVRSEIDPVTLLPAIREEVRALDPEQPIYMIRTVREAFAAGVASRRVAANVLALFATFALALAAVGIYGVVSFSVSQRTREIGVRMALGAERGRVRALMVRQGLTPVFVGAGIGLTLAVLGGSAVEGLLFGIGGTDPTTLAIVTTVLVGVAALAALAPAFRASQIDPARTLRQE